MSMQLSDTLRLSKTPRLAFVGAGGKTTALSILAKEMSKPLLVTTTTHLGDWQTSFVDHHVILGENPDLRMVEDQLEGIVLVTQNKHENRLVGLKPENMKAVYEFCEKHKLSLLMECDGSRQLPIKAPGKNEPLIPDFVDTVVVVAGLTCLGKSVNETTIHHPEIFSTFSNLQQGELITKKALVRLLLHKDAGLKNIPSWARKIVLLNQADTLSLQAQAGSLAKQLLNAYDGLIVAELQKPRIYGLFEPTAAIILAAGSSSRYGQAKQLLDYQGVPFIRAVTQAAIDANLDPIVIVTGADTIPIENAVKFLDGNIRIIQNPNWQVGQSASIKAGIRAITGGDPFRNDRTSGFPGSAIFLLADQPQVAPIFLRTLVDYHTQTLLPVIAPMVEGRRGNPVLFDRVTFPDLLQLEGDLGGRGIFSKYSPHYIPWIESSILLDVDTPIDYLRLING
jgi:molybdenum cofactor cytidylyltransferase